MKSDWLNGLGDIWWQRNKANVATKEDIISYCLDTQKINIRGKSVLEIGCANGWRLKLFHLRYGCAVCGIDPSKEAISEAVVDNLHIGTADDIRAPDNSFNVVVLGYCMYMIHPSEWMKVVSEVDRVLTTPGLLIINDLHHPINRFVRRYWHEHAEYYQGWSYNWPALWLCHPAYNFVTLYVDPQFEAVNVLRKEDILKPENA